MNLQQLLTRLGQKDAQLFEYEMALAQKDMIIKSLEEQIKSPAVKPEPEKEAKDAGSDN